MPDSPNLVPPATQILAPARLLSLAELARQARDALASVKSAFGDALGHALRVGKALNAAKPLVPEGQWLKWLRSECDLSERSAQLYMQLARALEEDPQRVADWAGLSLRAAVKRLVPATTKTVRTARRSNHGVRSNQQATTGLDLVGAWVAAPLPERQRAISNIGAKAILELFPFDWVPAVERWVAERRMSVAPSPVLIETGRDGFPELPDFLRRAPVPLEARS